MHSCTTFVLLICSLTSVLSVSGDAPCTDGVESASVTLRRTILCDYDPSVRPVLVATTSTNVSLLVLLKFIEFDETTNVLKVHSMTSWRWRDEFLLWNASTYDNLDKIPITTDDIWVPDVDLFNNADKSSSALEMSLMSKKTGFLKSNGDVSVISSTGMSVRCDADIRRWPFDTHNCSLLIGSWTHKASEINLTMLGTGITRFRYAPNRDWELLSVKGKLERKQISANLTYHTARFNLIIQRYSGLHAAIFFIPALTLATLTLLAFWLEPKSPERLYLIYFNIFGHVKYMQYLGETLPPNGDNYPLILLFFRDSLLMVAVALVITILSRRLDAATGSPPAWVTAVTDAVQVLLPEHELLFKGVGAKGASDVLEATEGSDVKTLETPRSWSIFVVLLDRVLFLAYFLTSIVLVSAFVP